jgi:predicted transcriptional regulator
MVDLRPYMVEMPLTVLASDKLIKVSNLFRHMQLKMLPVMAVSRNGPIVGVITRQNLF